MLKLTDVSHSFQGQQVLRGVSLTLQPGQRLCLMGPSGRGKTTLLRIAMGLLAPEGGTVENTFHKISAVFQEPRLLPWCTALENVNLVLGDTPATAALAKAHLERLGLSDALDKYPRELSGGMQQRVSLARALAYGGDLLILDEPFKAMDEELRLQVMALVRQTTAAVLLVTHERSEAESLGCEILQM